MMNGIEDGIWIQFDSSLSSAFHSPVIFFLRSRSIANCFISFPIVSISFDLLFFLKPWGFTNWALYQELSVQGHCGYVLSSKLFIPIHLSVNIVRDDFWRIPLLRPNFQLVFNRFDCLPIMQLSISNFIEKKIFKLTISLKCLDVILRKCKMITYSSDREAGYDGYHGGRHFTFHLLPRKEL